MVTPAVSLNSTLVRNPVQELTLTSTRAETVSEPTTVEREATSAILPAQVVSVSTIGEDITPTDQIEASPAERSLGAEKSALGGPDDAEAAVVRELAQRDREVRQHEMAHKNAAGSAAGAISYDYQRGPDGRLYAVGGEVAIRLSPPSNDPAEVQRYAEQILRAALAPAEPSGQDRQVAAQARAMIADAQAELAQSSSEAQQPERAGDSTEETEALNAASQREAEEEAKSTQDEIDAKRERAAESLAEFQQTLNEVNARLAEVNRKLVEVGILEELYAPGSVLKTTA